jgi:hypothetical protein
VHGQAGWLRSNLRLRLVSALDGTSIRFDIVVRIVRPETDSPAEPSRRGYPAGGNERLELYPARRVLVFRRGLFYLRSLAPGIFCREPRVRRGKELSRDGAHYQGR